MILNIGNKKLNCVQVIEENPVNNTYICEEIENPRKYYTVWELKDRAIAKELLKCQEYTGYVYQECIYFLFPYEEPRLIMNYYWHVTSGYPNLKEKILRECVIECMNTKIPYAVLLLILQQRQLHIGKDGSIHLGNLLSLEHFSEKKGESDCAVCCAELILELLQLEKKQNRLGISLLEKKKNSYTSFQELFWDVRLITDTSKKKKRNLKEGLIPQKDRIFRFLLWLSGIVLVAALFLFVTNLVLGDVSFYQLFYTSFEKIGTESLLQ